MLALYFIYLVFSIFGSSLFIGDLLLFRIFTNLQLVTINTEESSKIDGLFSNIANATIAYILCKLNLIITRIDIDNVTINGSALLIRICRILQCKCDKFTSDNGDAVLRSILLRVKYKCKCLRCVT